MPFPALVASTLLLLFCLAITIATPLDNVALVVSSLTTTAYCRYQGKNNPDWVSMVSIIDGVPTCVCDNPKYSIISQGNACPGGANGACLQTSYAYYSSVTTAECTTCDEVTCGTSVLQTLTYYNPYCDEAVRPTSNQPYYSFVLFENGPYGDGGGCGCMPPSQLSPSAGQVACTAPANAYPYCSYTMTLPLTANDNWSLGKQFGGCSFTCLPGYQTSPDGTSCVTTCPANTFGTDSCTACGLNMVSPIGSISINQCTCLPGSYPFSFDDNGTLISGCSCNGADYYSGGMNGDCTACPSNITQPTGLSTGTCRCNNGLETFDTSAGTCSCNYPDNCECRPGSTLTYPEYYDAQSNSEQYDDPICVCDTAAVYIYGVGCITCPFGSWLRSEDPNQIFWGDSVEVCDCYDQIATFTYPPNECRCPNGLSLDSTGYCNNCPENTYSFWDDSGNMNCPECGSNLVSPVGSTDISQCTVPIVTTTTSTTTTSKTTTTPSSTAQMTLNPSTSAVGSPSCTTTTSVRPVSTSPTFYYDYCPNTQPVTTYPRTVGSTESDCRQLCDGQGPCFSWQFYNWGPGSTGGCFISAPWNGGTIYNFFANLDTAFSRSQNNMSDIGQKYGLPAQCYFCSSSGSYTTCGISCPGTRSKVDGSCIVDGSCSVASASPSSSTSSRILPTSSTSTFARTTITTTMPVTTSTAKTTTTPLTTAISVFSSFKSLSSTTNIPTTTALSKIGGSISSAASTASASSKSTSNVPATSVAPSAASAKTTTSATIGSSISPSKSTTTSILTSLYQSLTFAATTFAQVVSSSSAFSSTVKLPTTGVTTSGSSSSSWASTATSTSQLSTASVVGVPTSTLISISSSSASSLRSTNSVATSTKSITTSDQITTSSAKSSTTVKASGSASASASAGLSTCIAGFGIKIGAAVCSACTAGTYSVSGNSAPCQVPAAGYYALSGLLRTCPSPSSVATCSPTTGVAVTCRATYALSLAGTCTLCPAGQYANNGTCAACLAPQSLTCDAATGLLALTCLPGLIHKAGVCTSCSGATYPKTTVFCAACPDIRATTCDADGTTITCKPGYANIAGTCSRCSAGTYALNSTCIACVSSTIATCDPVTGAINTCVTGLIRKSGACIPCTGATYAATPLSCHACLDVRSTSCDANGASLTCKTGWANMNGTCAQCTVGYASNSTCIPCISATTASCDPVSGVTLTCQPGLLRQSGACIPCAAGTYLKEPLFCAACLDAHASTCDSTTGLAITCKNGWAVSGTVCVRGTSSSQSIFNGASTSRSSTTTKSQTQTLSPSPVGTTSPSTSTSSTRTSVPLTTTTQKV